MSKEYLEALERLYCSGNLQLDYVLNNKHKQDYEIIEKALQRLESIDNAKPSEALKCLEKANDYLNNVYDYKEIKEEVRNDIETIKQALLKSQEQKKVIIELCEYCGMDNLYPYNNLEEIEITFKETFDNYQRQRIESLGRLNKQEKVLEIVFEKNVDIIYLKDSNNVEEYNSHFGAVVCKLTPEEYDAVKRYFK